MHSDGNFALFATKQSGGTEAYPPYMYMTIKKLFIVLHSGQKRPDFSYKFLE